MLVPGRIRLQVVAVLVALAGAACAGSGRSASAPAPSAPTTAPATSTSSTSATSTTTAACRPAPLEARAAKVLALGIGDATTAADPQAASVATLGVGGVILLGLNVVDEPQLRALVDGLHQASPGHLLVSVDEEGGRVSRLRPIVGPTPPARTLGQGPLADITAAGRQRGALLRDLGFDLELAPVVDAEGGPAGGAIGDRAFAATPTDAGPRAAAFVAGLRAAGMPSAAKHFPGQGGLADSHDGTVVSDLSRTEVERLATAGFRPVLDAGVPAVMMSHVTFTALGSRPASLEPGAYQLLRSMGFDGVAVTDAVGMSAITDRWTLPDAAVLAVAAGADLVLTTPADRAVAMRDAIVAAVADGRLPESRLDEAVRRVVRLGGDDPSTMVCPR